MKECEHMTLFKKKNIFEILKSSSYKVHERDGTQKMGSEFFSSIRRSLLGNIPSQNRIKKNSIYIVVIFLLTFQNNKTLYCNNT